MKLYEDYKKELQYVVMLEIEVGDILIDELEIEYKPLCMCNMDTMKEVCERLYNAYDGKYTVFAADMYGASEVFRISKKQLVYRIPQDH